MLSQSLCQCYSFFSLAGFFVFFFCINSRQMRISNANEQVLQCSTLLLFNLCVSDDSKGLKQVMIYKLLLHSTYHASEILSKVHQIN